MKKKGFVLMETIVVITILCVILLMLYTSYSKILTDVNKRSLYDNTEYIYKADTVRKYLESNLDSSLYAHEFFYEYCRNSLTGKECFKEGVNDYKNVLFKTLGVEAVYITVWDTSKISIDVIKSFEATTQNYIKMIDPTDEEGYRMIVMFKSENNETDIPTYEYATLRFGSRK